MNEQTHAMLRRVVADTDKVSKLTTEELLDLLPEPGDLDQQIVLLELFQRGALYQINERYPEDKEDTISLYNQYCKMLGAYRKLAENAAVPRG